MLVIELLFLCVPRFYGYLQNTRVRYSQLFPRNRIMAIANCEQFQFSKENNGSFEIRHGIVIA